ncbi:MAG: TRAP transporter TatT component family protein [Gammaproteobacteria bacterium]|nr:TRAP transporter TatT component family protein [Gammaproteobacteria bacterium]
MPIYRKVFLLFLLTFFLGACSSIISSATSNLAKNLSSAIINNDDLATVKAGAPAYLLMLDSFIEGDPENTDTLLAAANLYSAYAGVFVKEADRANRLTQKSLDFALQASCHIKTNSCGLKTQSFDDFERNIEQFEVQDIELLFSLGTSWAGWIQARSGDWNAAADLARVTKIMQHALKLDENYKFGQIHLYLGVLNTLLPPSLGGKPEIGQHHFKKAIEISKGKNLIAKVLYAEKYARLVFNQTLHDKLLEDVLKSDPKIRDFTLTNMLAQEQAKALLLSSKDYF